MWIQQTEALKFIQVTTATSNNKAAQQLMPLCLQPLLHLLTFGLPGGSKALHATAKQHLTQPEPHAGTQMLADN
jgi:hypothetical protein